MKTYKIKVEEYHIVEKDYYIEAPNKKDAVKRARVRDFDDAGGDKPTSEIRKVKIVSAELDVDAGWWNYVDEVKKIK